MKKNLPKNLADGKDPQYSTPDLGVSAALLSSGFTLVNFDNSDPRRVIFFFADQPALRERVADYWNDNLKVQALTFFNHLKGLKSRIHSI